MTTSYTSMTAAVTAAIKGELTTVNKWQTAGQTVRDFYGTETAINEVKAQFIADAIIPALDRKHAAALDKELCRKGSAEFNAFDAGQKDNWETANQAKKDARSVCDTYFNRIVKYAFPKEKEEQKRIEFLNNLSKLRKENLNMICYGLPEVYVTN